MLLLFFGIAFFRDIHYPCRRQYFRLSCVRPKNDNRTPNPISFGFSKCDTINTSGVHLKKESRVPPL